jgi:hypothetical protein
MRTGKSHTVRFARNRETIDTFPLQFSGSALRAIIWHEKLEHDSDPRLPTKGGVRLSLCQ